MRKTEPPRPLDRILLFAGIMAGVLQLGTTLFVGALTPGYSHLSQFLSELGASGAPHESLMNLAGILPSGLLTVAFAAGVFKRTDPSAMAVAGCLLLVMAGIGRALAGLFPCDPGCTFPPTSLSAAIHNVAGMTALWSGVFAPLAFSVAAKRSRHRWIFLASLVCGLIGIGAMAAGFWLGREAPIIGLLQRIVLMSSYGWVAVFGVWLGKRQ